MADPQVIDATDITIGPEAFGGTYDRTPPPPIVANDPKPLPGPATSYPAGAPLTGGGFDLANPQGLKEITAVATRAQRGKLQAETSAMMEESEQLKKHREAAEHFLEERGNFKMPKWDAEAEREKTTTSPWMALANPGLIISVLAAGKTRMAMTNAMNAAAGSINAIRAGDEKQYQQNFEAFKLNADLAIKQQEMLHTNYLEAMELYKTDPIMAEHKITMAATLAKDYVTLGLIQQKGPEAFWDIQTKVNNNMLSFAKGTEAIQEWNDTRAIRAHFGYDEKKPPTDPQNQQAVVKSQQYQAELKRMGYLGGTINQAIDRVREFHPDWDRNDPRILPEATRLLQATHAPNQATFNQDLLDKWAIEFKEKNGRDPTADELIEKKREISSRYSSAPSETIRSRAKEIEDQSATSGTPIKHGAAMLQAAKEYYGETAEARVTASAEARGDAGALAGLKKQQAAITTYENLAEKNGRVLVDLAKKVDATGVPVLERWIRAGRREVAGDPEVSMFNAQMQIYSTEVARILANPNLTGVLTDHARHEAQSFLDGAGSAEQIEAVSKLLSQDFKRRAESIEEGIATVQKRIRKDPASSAEGGPPKEGDRKQFKEGWGVFKDGKWQLEK